MLIGPPGRSVGEVGRSQLAAQAAALPDGDALMALYDAAIARFLAGEPVDPDPALPHGVQLLLQSLASPINLPFARELWTANAAPLLAQVDVPALVIIGKKDIQVDWQADGEPLHRAAAGRKDVTFLFPRMRITSSNMSHGRARNCRCRGHCPLQRARCPLDPQAMASMLEWLAAHV